MPRATCSPDQYFCKPLNATVACQYNFAEDGSVCNKTSEQSPLVKRDRRSKPLGADAAATPGRSDSSTGQLQIIKGASAGDQKNRWVDLPYRDAHMHRGASGLGDGPPEYDVQDRSENSHGPTYSYQRDYNYNYAHGPGTQYTYYPRAGDAYYEDQLRNGHSYYPRRSDHDQGFYHYEVILVNPPHVHVPSCDLCRQGQCVKEYGESCKL